MRTLTAKTAFPIPPIFPPFRLAELTQSLGPLVLALQEFNPKLLDIVLCQNVLFDKLWLVAYSSSIIVTSSVTSTVMRSFMKERDIREMSITKIITGHIIGTSAWHSLIPVMLSFKIVDEQGLCKWWLQCKVHSVNHWNRTRVRAPSYIVTMSRVERCKRKPWCRKRIACVKENEACSIRKCHHPSH